MIKSGCFWGPTVICCAIACYDHRMLLWFLSVMAGYVAQHSSLLSCCPFNLVIILLMSSDVRVNHSVVHVQRGF